MATFRNIHQHEWLYAWHYARYGRRHNSIQEHVGPSLRAAVRDVWRQRRDPLVVRQSMARTCNPLSAVIATHKEFRATLAGQ